MPKFQVYKSKDGQYRCRIIAANGEIIMWSEGYTAKSTAIKAAEWVKYHAPNADIIEI